jgi:hypothetical protein
MRPEDGRKVYGRVAFLMLVAAFAPAPAAFAQNYLFNQANFATGHGPRQVIAADFNKNGQPDLAVTNEGDDTVSILLATPSGSFSPQVTYATGNGPFAIATADFNNDGNPDLAITNLFDDTVTILLGSSNGTFTTAATVAVGTEPVAIATGLFTSSSNIDLAVVNLGSNTVSILIGNGDGTFQPQTTFATGAVPRSVTVGNFSNNGISDLAVVNSGANTLTILMGNGSGSFTPTATSPSTDNLPYWVTAGDFNNDGIPDLAVTNEGSDSGQVVAGTVSVFLGNGDGTFQARLDNTVGIIPTFVWAADFNGNGNLDLAVVNSDSNTVSVLLGNGNGTFQTQAQFGVGDFPITLAAADFNGDGKADLAVANSVSDAITVLLGDGDGTFVERTTTGVGTAPDGVATGLFNADSFLDVAVANAGASTISVLLGTGNGNFTVGSTPATGTGPAGLASADFNNDGKADLASANLTVNTVSVLLGNGDGTFGTHNDFATGTGPVAVAYGVFTSNGIEDLVTANSSAKTISVLLGNGDGTFQKHTDFTVGTTPMAVAVGSLRNNGILDLAVADFGSNQVSILLGTGTGSFGAQTTFTTGFEPSGIALGDFNGDGKLDIATANNGTVSVLLGNGDGTFQKHQDFSAGAPGTCSPAVCGSTDIAVGDFNGDGKLDVVVSNSVGNVDPGTASVLLGNGDGTLQPQVQYATGVEPLAVTAGSFTTTSGLDFVAVNSTSANITLFLNDPVISLFPPSINFGTVNVGSTGGPITLTVTNPSDATLDISSVTTAAPFSQTSNCVTNLAPGASCTASVSFAPTAGGTSNGSLSLVDTAVTSPQAAALSGTGHSNGPVATLNPTSLNFGNVSVGTTSPAMNVTLTNTGSATLNITSIVASSSYGQTNTCAASLGVNQSCTISVTFSPAQTGTVAGTITVTDNASGSPQTVSLTGTGTEPIVSLTCNGSACTAVNFGTVLLNTPVTQTITLSNTGNVTLDVTSIKLTGAAAYKQSNNCPSTINAGGMCTITVTFMPGASGTLTGTITITDNASNSPQTVSLTGQGTVVSFSPASLTFGSTSVGTSSPPQTITLTNTNTKNTLSITSITITGVNANDFSETNTCGSSVPAGGSCAITVTFTPLADGTLTASVSVADNGGGGTQTVPLTGTGTGAAPAVTLSPTSLNFGNVSVGTTSPAQNVTLTNTGNGTLNITSIVAGASYGQTNTCGSSLGAGLACTISVTFSPTGSGTVNGTLSITDNASGSPQTVSLTGVGVTAPAVSLSPTSLTFNSINVGTTSAAQNVTLTNTGSATLTVTSIVASANFGETNTCGTSVAAGKSCTISVTFTPPYAGSFNGTITITDNASNSPQQVTLSGTGVGGTPQAVPSPTTVTFATQLVNTTSPQQTITLTNPGTGNLLITGVTTSSTTMFPITNNCPISPSFVAPNGGSCTILVAFKPSSSGTKTGTVTITDNAAGSPQAVSLTGTGTVVSFSPTSLNFGSVNVGSSSQPQAITLTNNASNQTLSVTGVAITGADPSDFTQTNNCSSVPAKGTCTITVTFTPQITGSLSANVQVSDNGGGSPQLVPVSGTGQ